MGLVPVLKAFIAATLGGLGSLQGAVLGGLLLGAIEIYLAAYLPDAVLPYPGRDDAGHRHPGAGRAAARTDGRAARGRALNFEARERRHADGQVKDVEHQLRARGRWAGNHRADQRPRRRSHHLVRPDGRICSAPAIACSASTIAASASPSRPKGPYTTAMMAADAKALVDNLKLRDFHLVGVSMGGMISQEYALAYRRRPALPHRSAAPTPRRVRSARACSSCGRTWRR